MKPRDWLSERMVFGLLLIGGFFATGIIAVVAPVSSDKQLAKDMLLVVGPLLGVIVNAIWKVDKVDKQVADTAALLAAKAPDHSGTGDGAAARSFMERDV